MQLKLEKHVTNAGILLVAVLSTNILNLIFNALMGRLLSFEQYSLIALVVSLYYLSSVGTNALATSINFGVSRLMKRRETDEHQLQTAFNHTVRSSFKVVLILSAAWLLATPLLQPFFNVSSPLPLVTYVVTAVCSVLLYSMVGLEQGRMDFAQAGALIISEPLSKLGIALLFVATGLTQYTYLAIPLSLVVASMCALFILRRRKQPVKPSQVNPSLTSTQQLFPLSFFSAALLVGLSNTLFFSVDVVAVKHFFTPTVAGQYALLSLVGKMIFFCCTLANMFIVPLAARAQDAAQRRAILTGALAIAFVLGVCCMGGLYLTSGTLLPLLFGEKIRAIFPLLLPYSVAMVLLSLSHGLATFHITLEKYAAAWATLGCAIVFVILISMRHGSLLDVVQNSLISCSLLLGALTCTHLLAWKEERKVAHVTT